MISNQVLQNTVEGLKEISRTEFSVLDTEGKVLASTFPDNVVNQADVQAFVQSPAESQLIKGIQYFKVSEDHQLEYILIVSGDDDNTYMIGKLAVSTRTVLSRTCYWITCFWWIFITVRRNYT